MLTFRIFRLACSSRTWNHIYWHASYQEVHAWGEENLESLYTGHIEVVSIGFGGSLRQPPVGTLFTFNS